MKNYDLTLLWCDDELTLRPGFEYWFFWFFASKYIEYLDTVFLILAKKYGNSIGWTLQVYHHFITASVAWIAWFYPVPSFWVGLVTNTFVHIFMYAYFALAVYDARLRKFAFWITGLQLAQFYFCVALGVIVVPLLMYKNDCRGSWLSWAYICGVYSSFLVLFVLFAREKKKAMRESKAKKAALEKEEEEKKKDKSATTTKSSGGDNEDDDNDAVATKPKEE